jgi:hypothetical protein
MYHDIKTVILLAPFRQLLTSHTATEKRHKNHGVLRKACFLKMSLFMLHVQNYEKKSLLQTTS